MKKLEKADITAALLKRAKGYESCDVALEYVADKNENLKLNKKKVTKKYVSPDISAAKALLEFYSSESENEFDNLTDEELEAEKQKLLVLLNKVKGEENAEVEE